MDRKVGRLLSVNVGMPQEVAWRGRVVRTAVWKRPVTGAAHGAAAQHRRRRTGRSGRVTVHGRVIPLDIHSDAEAQLRQTLLAVYVPRYGPQWEEFFDSGSVYVRMPDERMSDCLTGT
jgi:hypothetical protein